MACLESLLIVRDGRPYKFARAGTRPPLKLGHDVVVGHRRRKKRRKKKGGRRRKKERGEEPIVRLRTGLAKRIPERARKRRASDRVECLRVSEAPFAEKPFVPSN